MKISDIRRLKLKLAIQEPIDGLRFVHFRKPGYLNQDELLKSDNELTELSSKIYSRICKALNIEQSLMHNEEVK